MQLKMDEDTYNTFWEGEGRGKGSDGREGRGAGGEEARWRQDGGRGEGREVGGWSEDEGWMERIEGGRWIILGLSNFSFELVTEELYPSHYVKKKN